MGRKLITVVFVGVALAAIWSVPPAQAREAGSIKCYPANSFGLVGGQDSPDGKAYVDATQVSADGSQNGTSTKLAGSACVTMHAGPVSVCLTWKDGGKELNSLPVVLDGKSDAAGFGPGGDTCWKMISVKPAWSLTKGVHVLTIPKDPSFKLTFYVDVPLPGSSGSPGPSGSAGSPGSGTSSGVPVSGLSARQVAAARSVASGEQSAVIASLQTPGDAARGGAAHMVQNVLLAGLLVLLLVFPSELFNSTFDEHHDRVMARVRRLTGRTPKPEHDEKARPAKGRQIGLFLAVVAAGAVLAELLDPHAGFDGKSAALFVGAVCASLVGAALGGGVGTGFRRVRRHSTDAYLKAVPLGLVVAAVCVVISRLVHFQPGYLFGLVGGLSFTVALDKREEGRGRLVACVVTLLVALAAWLLYLPVSSVASHPNPVVWAVVLNAVLAALFIGGIEGLLFGLLPLKFLPGHQLAQWSWAAWAAVTMVVAIIFVQVLLRPSTGYLGKSSTASVTVTYGLFAIFGVLSVAFWGWFRLRPDPTKPQPVEPAAS